MSINLSLQLTFFNSRDLINNVLSVRKEVVIISILAKKINTITKLNKILQNLKMTKSGSGYIILFY